MFESVPDVVWKNIGIFSTMFAAFMFAFVLWRRREVRRGEALKLLEKVAPWGIEPINKFLRAYGIGNYIGKDSMGRVVREVIADLMSEGGLTSMLKRVGWKVVKGVFLRSAEDREKLQKATSGTQFVN